MKKTIGFCALAFVASSACAEEAFMISSKVYDEGNLIGSPEMAVAPETEASVSQDHYTLNLALSDINDNTAKVSAKVIIDGEAFSPSFLVEFGKEATVTSEGASLSVTVQRLGS
ncbi:hypothetical protein [Gilvimarinus xylanilyticus]|uniref:Uncharacterized protein n=1 Tax=Gilvimarinus xylanilyticus TaxID=2944139 RepID=A0A9X2I2B5_9GAMM|nr:hypothetical protein [Gilvimarinus xylanilyticus]MCP8899498.1 hypothetical protein [Gilvimarinus xylanilyticus]